MKKTVLLIRNVAPEKYGGGESYQLMLAGQLKKHGFCPVVLSSSRKLRAEAKKAGYATEECPFLTRQNWSGWRNLLYPVYLAQISHLSKWYAEIFRKYQPVAINVQSRDDWLAATPVAKKLGIRVLWTDHMDFRSWVMQNVDHPIKNPIAKRILKTAKLADKVIFISDFERKYFGSIRRAQALRNLTVIKNGAIDSAAKFKDVRANSDEILYLGRLEDYKGVKELILAFMQIGNFFPKARLKIYGTGPYEKELKKLAGDRVEFCGFTNEPLAKMAESQIFVLASYREGLSLSLLDSAMLGRTIIASDVDGNPEIVVDQKTGLLVPAQNADALAEALRKVLSDKKLAQQLAKGARHHFEENFDFEKIFEKQMLELYEK